MSEVNDTYTAAEFRQFLLDELEATAAVLGWTAEAQKPFMNAQRRTLRVLGETEIAASAAPDLEIVGPVEIWRGVLNEVSTDHNFSADGGNYNRDQIYAHAELQFKRAMKDAKAAGFYPNDSMAATSTAMDTRQRW